MDLKETTFFNLIYFGFFVVVYVFRSNILPMFKKINCILSLKTFFLTVLLQPAIKLNK